MGLKPRAPELSPEMLEKFRQVGIKLDRNGRFWHEGAEVTHPGLHRALLSWLDRLDDGRRILRLDDKRYAYVDVEDADLLVTSIEWTPRGPLLHLNDDSEELLDPRSLRIAADNAVYCAARNGRLRARLTTPAYYKLAERIEQTPAGFALRLKNQLVPIST